MGDTFTLEESTGDEYALIPDGTVLEAKVGSAKVVTTKMVDEETGDPVKQVEFTFIVQDETCPDEQGNDMPVKGRKAWGRTSTKFTTHENCRLRAWVTEIMAVNELQSGFRLDLEALEGSLCRIVVEVNTWEDKKAGPDPDTGETRYKSNNRVKEVIRSRTAKTSYNPAEEPF